MFSFGGSVLAPDKVYGTFIESVAGFLIKNSNNHKLAVICGGGKPARRKINEARKKGAREAECDHIGVLATRENASVLAKALGSACVDAIPLSLNDAQKLFGKPILVMGGTEPGHSTDAVAVLLAEWVGADLFINASNVDAVYDKNPAKYGDAAPLAEIGIDDLITLLGGEGVNAGQYPLLDPLALKIIKRSKIKTILLDGRDLKNMQAAVDGENFRGTRILF